MKNLNKKNWWFRIYIFIILFVSLAFISLNILAEVEETPTNLKDYLGIQGCPKPADVTEISFKDACTGLVWARHELPTFFEANDLTPGYNWEEAKTACETLAPAGLFRLPTLEELSSLINYICDGTTCQAKSNIAMFHNENPAFAKGIYWTSSDFNEPESDTDINYNPPGNAGRDYKRSVNLLTGVVDSPVFGKDMRLNALCIVNRDPGIVEKEFTTATVSGQEVTGGTLKTIYHRECADANDCSKIGATMCEPRTIYVPGCGNSIIDFGEECDGTEGTAATPAESTSSKQYSCTPNCYSTAGWCGDNTVQASFGEQCDGPASVATTPADSSSSKHYDCTDDCQFAGGYCGDSTVQAKYGEECDDGNSNNNDACDNTCHHYCGDGAVQATKGEQCDDGNSINDDVCDNACQWTIKELTPITLNAVNKLEVSGDGVVYDTSKDSNSAVDSHGTCGTNECSNDTTIACTQNIDCDGNYLKVATVMATPYIWIANSNYNTVTKMRTFTGKRRNCYRSGGEIDCKWENPVENQGQKIGTYTVGSNPSRTAVNVETGDVWIANRDSGTVTKLDINGNILKTCCTTIPCNPTGYSTGPRGLAIEEDGDVWVANYGVYGYYWPGTVNKIPGDDTTCPTSFEIGVNSVFVGGYPYGLAIDSNGNIWVSNSNSGYWGIQKIVMPLTSTPTVQTHYAPGVYGITIDKDDNAWGGGYGYPPGGAWVKGVYKVPYNASANSVAEHYGIIGGDDKVFDTTGITVDLAGNIWASAYNNNKVVKYNQSTGAFLDSFDQRPFGEHPHGIAGDSQGNIWSVQLSGDNARVYNANGVNQGDYCVYCTGAPVQNYTYSDMTGLNRAMLLRTGIWMAKFDGNSDNQHWGKISYTQNVPGQKQSIEVLVRASNYLDLHDAAWQTNAVWNDAQLDSRAGRYLQIKITLRSNERGVTPVVYNLKIEK